MRNNFYSSLPSPLKVSVRQLTAANQSGAQGYWDRQPQKSKQYCYPPNHIVSDSSLASCGGLNLSRNTMGETRQRRRKIFERKVLRATVVSGQKNQRSLTRMASQSPECVDYSPQSRKQQLGDNIEYERQYENSHANNHSHSNQKLPKLPSFARNTSDSHINLNLNQDSKQILQPQTLLVLSSLPEQVHKLRQQVLEQKKELSQLGDRVKYRSQENQQREKQLLATLVGKQDQLTRKQGELNESLEKIVRVQTESNQRYQQLLKNELEMQRAKRVEQLTMENAKLSQQLLRNQSRDTVDATRISISQPSPLYPSYNPAYSPSQYQNTHMSINKYFKEVLNEKEISALENRCQYTYEGYEDEDDDGQDNNNTIRELLSPLEIAPDYNL